MLLLVLVGLLPLQSCATIISGSTGHSAIGSTPGGATFTISRNGVPIQHGTTPMVVELPKKGRYSVRIEREGYEPVEMRMVKGVSGWYLFGNIVFGGLIGWLIVDPITGAMFTLPDVNIVLKPMSKTVSTLDVQEGLVILALGDIPAEYRGQLVPLH